MPPKLVAIHQPNFFPWLGFFDKIARADAFCLMDNAQFPKTGGTWINRVRMSVAGDAAWVTAPVERAYHGVRAIREIMLDESAPWRERVKSTVRMSYRRAARFDEAWPLLEPLIDHPEPRLAAYNEHAIRAICAALGLDGTRLVLGSSLAVEGRATDLLVSIVRALGGGAYLCGGGAGGYQDDGAFAAAGIDLVPQAFAHPVYDRGGAPFVPGLSIIDALMHCGPDGTRRLLGCAS